MSRLFPRNKKPSIWLRIEWKLRSLWTTLRNIPNNVKMICEWIPVLWNNWDWDFNFLLIVMQYKLRRMHQHIYDHGIVVNSSKYVKQMRTCDELINRLLNRNYIEKEEETHKKKWGELICDSTPLPNDDPLFGSRGDLHIMDIYRPLAREQGLDEQESKEFLAIHNLGTQRRNRDLDALFSIMRKRIEYWWD